MKSGEPMQEFLQKKLRQWHPLFLLHHFLCCLVLKMVTPQRSRHPWLLGPLEDLIEQAAQYTNVPRVYKLQGGKSAAALPAWLLTEVAKVALRAVATAEGSRKPQECRLISRLLCSAQVQRYSPPSS